MYAGVDKYGGALAGEGQPRGGTGPAAPTGLSLEDAIETAAAEETVVVDVPYSYYEDEADEATLVTGSSRVLLAAQLNPEAGGLMWIEQEDVGNTYQSVLAMSQMTSMLRDTDRNACYERGIARTIAAFRQQHQRAPVVLDIGTGTGLLAMFAARHGAQHVYACEMFAPLAAVAQRVTQANFPPVLEDGSLKARITVIPRRSTDLVVAGEAGDHDPEATFTLPCRADMLVSELFDSILLGEAVIPTVRHAQQHLLTPNAVILPRRASVYAHVVENPTAFRFNSLAGHYVDGDTQRTRLARNNLAWTCTGGRPALPLHLAALQADTRALTAPGTRVLSVDFTSLPTGIEPLGVATHELTVPATASGDAHAVFMWWEVHFDGEDEEVVDGATYSTQPGVQNWQDHWVQVVYPLPGHAVRADESVVIRTHHDDLRIWFDVVTQTSPSTTLPVSTAIEDLRSPCVCGLHLLCNAERISMLTDPTRSRRLHAALQRLVVALTASTSRPPSELSCLDVGDGSLCALVAASALGVGHVSSIESKPVSARIWQQLCAGNGTDVDVLNSGVKGIETGHLHGDRTVDLLVAEPFYYAMQNLPLWQALNYWLRRTALQSVLSPQAVVLPARARVLALPVVFKHLHECFGAVGTVSGFDHSAFDEAQGSSHWQRDFPFPVFMYEYEPCTAEPMELAAWNYRDVAHSITQHRALVLDGAPLPNAVVVWVEYTLTEEEGADDHSENVLALGPAVPFAKQLVRFLPPLDQGEKPAVLNASWAFSALEGTLALDFALQRGQPQA